MLWPIELASALILGLFLTLMALRGLRSARPGHHSFGGILRDVGLIAVLAWCAEVLSIRLFGFYQYDAPWLLFIDVMPALGLPSRSPPARRRRYGGRRLVPEGGLEPPTLRL